MKTSSTVVKKYSMNDMTEDEALIVLKGLREVSSQPSYGKDQCRQAQAMHKQLNTEILMVDS